MTSKKSVKFDNQIKASFESRILNALNEMPGVKNEISRLELKAGRIYLYHLVEIFKFEGAVYIKPLIDDKYVEYPYARITVYDVYAKDCTLDWQRHNEQWISVFEGNLEECIRNIDSLPWFVKNSIKR